MNLLFSKKYKPIFLEDCNHNIVLKNNLINLARNKELPHILLCGSKNIGKYTFAKCFLNTKFNQKIVTNKNIFTISGNLLDVLVSKYHFEIDLKMCKTFQKKLIVIDFIKEISRTKNIGINDYKILIIRNFHLIKPSIQYALRRIMEKCIKTIRFILITDKKNKVIEAIHSRCLTLQLKNISNKENYKILQDIAIKENIIISPEIINIIIKLSNGINNSIDLLQLYHDKPESVIENDNKITELKNLVLSGNPKNISKINSILFDLFIINIDIRSIMKKIMKLLINETNDVNKKIKICNFCSDIEYRMCLGNKDMLYLQYFFVEMMKLYY